MLLRRIAIFTSFSSAHRTYAYSGVPDTTKVWLEYDPAVPKRHDALVSALTDATWGLGMRVESDDCACATGGMCVTVLTTAAGDAALRLQSVADRPAWGREYFEEIDAPRKWLDRVARASPHACRRTERRRRWWWGRYGVDSSSVGPCELRRVRRGQRL